MDIRRRARELVADVDLFLVVTMAVAVGLSVGLWLVGIVPFNERTFALHIFSIYIGVAGGLLIYRRRR